MVSLFNKLQRGGLLASGQRAGAVTDTIRSFSGRNLRSTRRGKSVVNFNIPYLPQHEKLRTAEVRFLRHPDNNANSRRYKFRIHIRKNGKIAGKFVVRQRCVAQGEYDVFDVTDIVRPWINSYHGNISLQIRVSKKLQRQTLVALKDTSLQSTSLIVLYLEDSEFLKNMYTSFTEDDIAEHSTHRAKRDLSLKENQHMGTDIFDVLSNSTILTKFRVRRDSKKNRRRRTRKNRKWFRTGRKENCQIYDFEVDFNAIGWGQWIIHPKRFNSRFCFGQCPSPIDVKYKPTNHAMLQTLMRMKRPNVAPLPCCVPTRLSPVSMLYFEYDEIVVRHHEDMVADECGCR
ncbi:nodal homolog [Aplysia californica]|uniref:Nodal homolog n=2 Tax=Aplysia californica TaxID=6500 RepID=A0ABM0ZUI6_APLCA|nr:nodal homolog [Aplysia californica]